MKSTTRKLNHVEKKLLGPVTEDSAQFSYYALSEPEQRLFDTVHKLDGVDPATFTDYQRKLCHTALDRQTKRIFMLFFRYVRYVVCEDDPIAQYMFYGWFLWFMEQARQGVWQFLREQEIYDQKGKTWKQREKEADQFYKDHWNHDLFSRESFEKVVHTWSEGIMKREAEEKTA